LSAVSGDCSAGLSTIELPMASAGATFHIAMRSGKFHGTMAPITPSGSWTVNEKRSLVSGRPRRRSCRALPHSSEACGSTEDVDVDRVLDRLADIEALKHGERLGIALHEVGEAKEDALLLAVVETAHLRLRKRAAPQLRRHSTSAASHSATRLITVPLRGVTLSRCDR
jgi:hypothetical protein